MTQEQFAYVCIFDGAFAHIRWYGDECELECWYCGNDRRFCETDEWSEYNYGKEWKEPSFI